MDQQKLSLTKVLINKNVTDILT